MERKGRVVQPLPSLLLEFCRLAYACQFLYIKAQLLLDFLHNLAIKL